MERALKETRFKIKELEYKLWTARKKETFLKLEIAKDNDKNGEN